MKILKKNKSKMEKIASLYLYLSIYLSIYICIYIYIYIYIYMASLVAQSVKNLPAMLETQVRSLGWENPLQ